MEVEPQPGDGEGGSENNNHPHKPTPKRRDTRTRVSRACDRCRSKKDKCDGQRPSCSACIVAGQECLYDPSTRKRGLPEGYVRGLEKLFALAVNRVQGLEETLTGLMGREDVPRIWNHERMGDELHERWKQSSVAKELERLLVRLESGPNNDSKRKSDQLVASDLLRSGVGKSEESWEYHIEDNTKSTTGASYVPSTPINASKRLKLTPTETEDSRASGTPAALPPQAAQLVELYFSHTQNWFPIIERHKILKLLYEYEDSREMHDRMEPTGTAAALWAILAYAHCQDSAINAGSPNDSDALYQTAEGLIPADSDYGLGHVQALLLLSMINLGHAERSKAWHLCGRAVRAAIDMNLHSEDGANGPNKVVFLGCFLLDTHISAQLGRCPHLRSDDAEVTGPILEDGSEEWDPWVNSLQGLSKAHALGEMATRRRPVQALSCFNRLVGLYCILNDIIRDSSKDSDREAFCERQALKVDSWWREKLPKSLRGLFDTETEHPLVPLPHQAYLHLSYLMVLMALSSHLHSHLDPVEDLERRPPLTFTGVSFVTLKALEELQFACTILTLPPVLAYAVELAVDGARNSHHYSGGSESPETLSSYSKRMSTLIHQLEKPWQIFASIRKRLGKNVPHSRLTGSTPYTRLMQSDGPSSVPIHDPNFDRTDMIPSDQSHREHGLRQDTGPLSAADGMLEPKPAAYDLRNAYSNAIAGPNQGSTSDESTIAPEANRHAFGGDVSKPDHELGLTPGPTVDSISIPNLPNEPDLESNLGTLMDDDVDAIFRDLAYLDTTDWTNDREQGLRDFGFADENTFQAFCNDPERLVPNTVLPQPPGHARPDFWPPPGFFPGHFPAPRSNFEGTQMLQPPSESERFPTIPESVGW